MIKKLLPVLSLILALTMLVVMVVPVLADRAPAGANNNNLNVSIAADPSPTPPGTGPYHVGDVIHYQVIVNVPFFVSPTLIPAWQSGVDISFDPIIDNPALPTFNDPIDDTLLGSNLDFLPGEQVIFTSGNATFTRYREEAGKPTRAELTATSSNFTMPSDANFNTIVVPGSFPILDHTIGAGNPPNEVAASEMFLSNGLWEESAVARVVNVEGSHSSDSFIDSNDKLTSITIPISIPGTTVAITSSNSTVAEGQHVTLTVTENNTGDVNLTSPHVVIHKNGASFTDLVAPPNGGGDIFSPTGVLNGSAGGHAEKWTWTFDSGPLTAATYFEAWGHGMDDSTPPVDITTPGDPNYPLEHARVDINVNTPGTLVGIQASLTPTVLPPGGGTADLTFTEHNTSNVIALSNVKVTVLKDGLPFTVLTAPPASGDFAPTGVLDPLETWSWTIFGVPITATTTFTATGYGEYGSDPVIQVTTPSDPDFPQERFILQITVPPPHETPASSDWAIGLLIAGIAGLMVFFGYRRMHGSQT